LKTHTNPSRVANYAELTLAADTHAYKTHSHQSPQKRALSLASPAGHVTSAKKFLTKAESGGGL